MKALSIRQPWVELILQGRKTLEIRSWSTDYRGPLTIHAAVNVDSPALKHYPLKGAPRGGLIGAVELAAVERLDADQWAQLRAAHCCPERWDPKRYVYAFHLRSPRRFNCLIPLSGRPFLFDVSENLTEVPR